MAALLIVSTALSIIVFNPMNAFHSHIGSHVSYLLADLIRAVMYFCLYIEPHHLPLLQLSAN